MLQSPRQLAYHLSISRPACPMPNTRKLSSRSTHMYTLFVPKLRKQTPAFSTYIHYIRLFAFANINQSVVVKPRPYAACPPFRYARLPLSDPHPIIAQNHNIAKPAAAASSVRRPKFAISFAAPPVELGILFVAAPPRYQLPMSVNFPLLVNMATLGPTFDTSLRNAPKYEYRVVWLMRSKYSAELLKKDWVSKRLEFGRAYSVTQTGRLGYLAIVNIRQMTGVWGRGKDIRSSNLTQVTSQSLKVSIPMHR